MPEIYAPQYRPWLEDDDEWLTRLRQDGALENDIGPRQTVARGRRLMEEVGDVAEDREEGDDLLDLASSGDVEILSDEVAAELGRLPAESALKKVFWELLEFEPADDSVPRDLVVPTGIGGVRIIASLEKCAVLIATTHSDDGLEKDIKDLRVLAKNAQKIFGTVVIVARHDQQVRTVLLGICSAASPRFFPLVRDPARMEAARALVRLNSSLGSGGNSNLKADDGVSDAGDAELSRWLSSTRPISEHWLELQVTSSRLLSAEEERELFSRLAKLWPQHEREANDYPLSPEACRVFNALLRANLRMAAHHARRYFFRIGRGLTFEDLYQAGVEALCISIQRFDPARQLRFSTYATWWVRQCITREIGNREAMVRIPIHILEAMAKVTRRRRMLEAKFGPISTEELAESCGLTEEKTARILELEGTRTVFIDEELDDSSLRVSDQLVDDVFADPAEQAAVAAELGEETRNLLSQLSPRQEQILRMRFGIGLNTDYTLEEVGKQFAVTRERIRQIEAKALDKLRAINGLPPAKQKKPRAQPEERGILPLKPIKIERGPVASKEKRRQQLTLFETGSLFRRRSGNGKSKDELGAT